MTFHKIFLWSFLMLFGSCNGQERSNAPSPFAPLKRGPTVIRNFKAVGMAPDFDTTLVSQYIRSIFQDSKGNLWFGTLGEGVVRYDVKTLTYFSKNEGLESNTIFAIHEDKNGNLWIGTDRGVYRYDGKTFRNYNKKDGLLHTGIGRKSILIDRSGTLWVGTGGGVFRYDASADSTGGQSFSVFPLIPSVEMSGILEDKNGNIWFATQAQGVYRYDGTQISHIVAKEELGRNYAGGMAQDRSGNMWFTMKYGICRYDGKTWKEYTAKDGLPGTEFSGIYIEYSGMIWVTTRGSTTRFDPTLPTRDPRAFTVFTAANGFTCCIQSMYQDRSGTMWFGTGQGVFRFDGSRLHKVKQNGPW